jgi:phage/conjugal plasmid C-4 type zinc finger TraR family protein
MADEIDIAQERIEADMAHRIATRTVYTGISAKECECGEEIPEGRRQAIPGVRLCVGCAERAALVKSGVRRA